MSIIGLKETQKIRVLEQVLCIYSWMQFQKDKGKDILALLNSESKWNAMIMAYPA